MGVRRHPVFAVVGLGLVLVVAVIASTTVAVWRAAHHDDAADVQRVDVILVLGAAQYDGRPSPVFAGRLDHAALLYRQGRAERIVVLGGRRPGDRSTEAEAGRGYLIEQGVPAGSVSASAVGRTTLESLRAAVAYMARQGMDSAFLVSDPWHNLRIKRMAGDLGIRAYASATWHSAARTEWTRFAGYLRETLAYLSYRLLGR